MKKMIVHTLTLLLMTLTLAATSSASPKPDNSDIYGLWLESKKQKVAVLIEDCDARLCGYIYWLKKPLTADGLIKRDPRNPDAALRDRPLCGLKTLSGFRRVSEDTWSEGQIYNPKDGQTFASTIKLSDDGSLKIRGYVGISLFGKTLIWQRPQEKLQPCS
ncbi:MAG: DUF2147 domain-containing protein [Gammaproteobacteria bacterium]|nr:DUF2147 domain-containing protein [Gammaproteobacteria bacterium]